VSAGDGNWFKVKSVKGDRGTGLVEIAGTPTGDPDSKLWTDCPEMRD